jgi:GntR family transcriptional repressor for pyruvate dehydrogenase complex
MTFEKVAQTRFKKKSSFIADQILLMINTGRYKAGSRLPSERVISEQMGVSRPSLREAISALQIVGILESRPGDGTYVSAPAASEDLTRQALTVLEECDSPYENMQARRDEKCERGRRGDLEEYLRYGKEFHLTIARATKNRVIEGIMEKLLDLTIQPLWINMRREYFRDDPSRIELMLDIHDRIVKAISDRDTARTIRELEIHFDIQIEQLYNRNDENHADSNGKSGSIEEGKRG